MLRLFQIARRPWGVAGLDRNRLSRFFSSNQPTFDREYIDSHPVAFRQLVHKLLLHYTPGAEARHYPFDYLQALVSDLGPTKGLKSSTKSSTKVLNELGEKFEDITTHMSQRLENPSLEDVGVAMDLILYGTLFIIKDFRPILKRLKVQTPLVTNLIKKIDPIQVTHNSFIRNTLVYCYLFSIRQNRPFMSQAARNCFLMVPLTAAFLKEVRTHPLWRHMTYSYRRALLADNFAAMERPFRSLLIQAVAAPSKEIFDQLLELFLILNNSYVPIELDFFRIYINFCLDNFDYFSEEQAVLFFAVGARLPYFTEFPHIHKPLQTLYIRLYQKFPGDTPSLQVVRAFSHLRLTFLFPDIKKIAFMLAEMPDEEIKKLRVAAHLIFYMKKHEPRWFQFVLDRTVRDRLSAISESIMKRQTAFQANKYLSFYEEVGIPESNDQEKTDANEEVEYSDLYSEMLELVGLQTKKEVKIGMYHWDFLLHEFYYWAKYMFKQDPRFAPVLEKLKEFCDTDVVLEIQGLGHYLSGYKYESAISEFKTRLSFPLPFLVVKIDYSSLNPAHPMGKLEKDFKQGLLMAGMTALEKRKYYAENVERIKLTPEEELAAEEESLRQEQEKAERKKMGSKKKPLPQVDDGFGGLTDPNVIFPVSYWIYGATRPLEEVFPDSQRRRRRR